MNWFKNLKKSLKNASRPRRKANTTAFFNYLRQRFPNGRLLLSQVEGMTDILEACLGLPNEHTAYVLATAYHETGARMQPVREGFAKSDASARRAVARLYKRGRISRNYALPLYKGNSFYGRGYVQLTHFENYRKTGKALGVALELTPDLMLDSKFSAKAMVWGMRTGAYRNRSLSGTITGPNPDQWRLARNIINGDVRKNGRKIGNYAAFFYEALEKMK